MSQQEYLTRQMFESTKFISRNKVRDQSEQVLKLQAQANKTVVAAYRTGSVIGAGTQGEYTGIMLAAQACAICSDVDPVAKPSVTIACATSSHTEPPWAQQGSAAPYIPACQPGKADYFPPKLSVTCSTNQIRYPFPSG